MKKRLIQSADYCFLQNHYRIIYLDGGIINTSDFKEFIELVKKGLQRRSKKK